MLILVGRLLEANARSRATHALRALLELRPTTARRVRDLADTTGEDVPLDALAAHAGEHADVVRALHPVLSEKLDDAKHQALAQQFVQDLAKQQKPTA